jgi:FkbM family methyltransferase
MAANPAGFNVWRECRGGPLIFNRNDLYIGASLAKYGEFSWLEQELFAEWVSPGAVVVEAGANIGVHTVCLSRLAGPQGAVLAFEPQRLAFQLLCGNVALNQCENVAAYQEALGARDDSLAVPSLDPRAPNNFGGLALGAFADGERVALRRLDALALPGCHFLKVDVEGMEADVLRGAANTIARHRPIIYVENDRIDRSSDLVSLILEQGYRPYWHTPPLFNPDNFAGDAENVFPGIVSVNMLCVPSESRREPEGLHLVRSPTDRPALR